MPSATSDGVTGVINGKLYVATFGRLYRYTPSSNTWTTLASSPYAHFAAAGGVINGKLYVAGGNAADGGGTGTQLHVYDPATNRWTAKAPMPTGRTWVAGAVLKNKLYIVGGRGAEDLLFSGKPVGQVVAVLSAAGFKGLVGADFNCAHEAIKLVEDGDHVGGLGDYVDWNRSHKVWLLKTVGWAKK